MLTNGIEFVLSEKREYPNIFAKLFVVVLSEVSSVWHGTQSCQFLSNNEISDRFSVREPNVLSDQNRMSKMQISNMPINLKYFLLSKWR